MFHVEHNKEGMKKLICSTKDYLISGEAFSIVWDNTTQYAHTHPRPINQQLDFYHASENYISHNDSNKNPFALTYRISRNWMFRVKYRMFKSRIPNKAKVLDYGCGTGEFLNYLSKKKHQTAGIEPNFHARSQCKQKGLNVVSSLEQLLNNEHDLITLWHVLEHVPDLEQCLRSIKTQLKKKGTLLIAVPNLNSFDAKYYEKYWAAFDVPRHLWHFSKEGMKTLVEPFGFELVRKYPLMLDALYIGYISEQHKGSRFPFLRGMFRGIESNIRAFFSGEYSSLVYVFKKIK
tara:strand:- start:2757 stop:3626 length:870 start_codon:yes stop_codon:yes gene_type:complete